MLQHIVQRGYRLVGPTVRDGAIVYDTIADINELPAGYSDEQAPGHYRLHQRNDQALFAYAVGPHSWKQELFPPRQKLWQAQRQGDEFILQQETATAEKRAFIGVRACELAAIAIQDRVFTGGIAVDESYAARRRDLFILAVHCTHPASTCFCTSMDTGPTCQQGFDLALTELLDADEPRYVLEIGSEAGAEMIQGLGLQMAEDNETTAAKAAVDTAASTINKKMNTDGLRDLLYANPDHPRWDEVAERCVSCGNCTMVCPTCFCSTVEDHTSLDGQQADRVRQWASCFDSDFTHLAGSSPSRSSTTSRYRHWLTHKLASWQDQFGSSGCVGCGRCISWCPPGIDLTEEVHAIRATIPPNSSGDDDGQD